MERTIQPLSPDDEARSDVLSTDQQPLVPQASPYQTAPIDTTAPEPVPAAPVVMMTPMQPLPPAEQPVEPETSAGTTQPSVIQQTMPQTAPPAETSATDDPSQMYGMSASSLGIHTRPDKGPLPKGIYVIAALSLIGAGQSFIDTSSSNGLATIVLIINLLLAVGLFLRINAARISYIVVTAIVMVASVVAILGFMEIEHRLNVLEEEYQTAISTAEARGVGTKAQVKAFNDLSDRLMDQKKDVVKRVRTAELRYGAIILVEAGIIIYLTRPRVRAAFDSAHLNAYPG